MTEKVPVICPACGWAGEVRPEFADICPRCGTGPTRRRARKEGA